MVLPSGQESFRIRKVDQMQVGDGDEMGLDSDPYKEISEDVNVVPKVHDWLLKQDMIQKAGIKRKSDEAGPSSLISKPASRKLARKTGYNASISSSVSSSSRGNYNLSFYP